MTDLVIRPLSPGEEHVFDSLPDPALVGFAAFGRPYRQMMEEGVARPEWTWVALRDGVVVARAAWTGGPADERPNGLSWLDFTDREAAIALLDKAPRWADYCLVCPPGWRDRPDVRAAAEARIEVAVASGLRPFVERYHYEWTPEQGVPDRPGRLEFRAAPTDDSIVDILRRMHHGTLDAHARRIIERSGIEAAVQEDLEILHWFPAPREWWRTAHTTGGETVGLAVPSRNYSAPIVGLIGVVPEQRGHGYAYDLLVECTHILVAEGAERIVADTDRTNTPMAATFTRAGYPIVQERIFLEC